MQCILWYNIDRLPVDLYKITKPERFKLVRNSDVHELSGDESGLCVFNGKRWYIIYDDEASLGKRRFTIAHELGHIFLGHVLQYGYYRCRNSPDKPIEEREADMFAAQLLAPTCVLLEAGLTTWEGIMRECAVSKARAIMQEERINKSMVGKEVKYSMVEKKVLKLFKEYIGNYINY